MLTTQQLDSQGQGPYSLQQNVQLPNFYSYLASLPQNVQSDFQPSNLDNSNKNQPYLDPTNINNDLSKYFNYQALANAGYNIPQQLLNGPAGINPANSPQWGPIISNIEQQTNAPSDSINGGGFLKDPFATNFFIPAVAAMLTAGVGGAIGGGLAASGAIGDTATADAVGSGLAGATTGAASSGLEGKNPLIGALTGGAESAGGSFLGSNLFGSAANVAPADMTDLSPGSFTGASGPMSLPGGQSAMGSFGSTSSPSPSVNFGESVGGQPSPFMQADPLASSGTTSLSPIGDTASIANPAGSNISGAAPAASPSIFDNLAQGNVGNAASGVGSLIANNPIPSLVGAGALYQGINTLAGGPSTPSTGAPPPFSPSEQSPLSLPGSLSSYANLNPDQQATNIATGGVYGGGQGPDETNYFLNLMNRKLFNPQGGVVSDTSGLAPIDMSYLSQLGINQQDPTGILQGISQYGT